MLVYPTFTSAIADTRARLQKNSRVVHTERWQGVNISSKPEMATHELLHHSIQVRMVEYGFDLERYQRDIRPNLPWADDHFLERVCGEPINPGIQWANWPYGHSAARFLDDQGKFNHNYMERYWPKYANFVHPPSRTPDDFRKIREMSNFPANSGIRYEYGDLRDVVKLLRDDPLTRQAYLPVWFPEDTGGGDKRAPCTLGYHFIMRDGRLDVTYYIRSCDYLRHFRDDIYLTVRLALWVIEECRRDSAIWEDVVPGIFVMHITSLHLFKNDFVNVYHNNVDLKSDEN